MVVAKAVVVLLGILCGLHTLGLRHRPEGVLFRMTEELKGTLNPKPYNGIQPQLKMAGLVTGGAKHIEVNLAGERIPDGPPLVQSNTCNLGFCPASKCFVFIGMPGSFLSWGRLLTGLVLTLVLSFLGSLSLLDGIACLGCLLGAAFL